MGRVRTAVSVLDQSNIQLGPLALCSSAVCIQSHNNNNNSSDVNNFTHGLKCCVCSGDGDGGGRGNSL